MGVTLERVQFKFASIIGELCSEPDILSQFAVWVDLRLAEYKLKGSISLDCSGDTPDPVWLKGIVSALLKRQLAKQKSSVQSYIPSRPSPSLARSPASRAQRPAALQSPGVNEDEVVAVNERLRGPDITSPRNHGCAQPSEVRLSPDIVIKEEPADDEIYPISLHVHEHGSKESRKRTASETITSKIESLQSDSHFQQHSPKSRRVDPNSAADIQTSNESLMSIIGLGDHSQDSSTISVENINSDCDFILATEVAQNANQELAAQMGGNSSMHLTPQRGSGAAASNVSGQLVRDPSTGNLAAGLPASHSTLDEGIRKPQRSRLVDASSLLEGYDRHTRCYINVFARWLLDEPRTEQRNMEDLPPTELDAYLVEFFSTVRRRTGDNYDSSSFNSLRSGLERYLKDTGYPYSISRNPSFIESQHAFSRRKNILKEACLLQKGELQHFMGTSLWQQAASTPESLLVMMLWVNAFHFDRLRFKKDHLSVRWGDIELMSLAGEEFLVLKSPNWLKSSSEATANLRAFANPQDPDHCPVNLYKEYRRRRPSASNVPCSAFYLQPSQAMGEHTWFSRSLGPAGMDILFKQIKQSD